MITKLRKLFPLAILAIFVATSPCCRAHDGAPTQVSRINGRKLSPDELVFAASLQGVVAKTSPRITNQ